MHHLYDRWLEEYHPAPNDSDAYLFCLTEPQGDVEPDQIQYHPASYRYFSKQLKKAKKKAKLDCDAKTHTIRKARISFLKALGVPESAVDKRVGHIVGSDTTREYTRLSDSDSNQAYAKGYGEEDNGNDLEEDLVPLNCTEFETTNPGFRDRSYNCNGLLEIKEVKSQKETTQKAKELIWKSLEDKGLTEEILEKMKEE